MIRGLISFVAVAVVLAILAVVLSLFLFNVILTTEEVQVPDVVNMRVEEAISTLSQQGLAIDPIIERYNEEIEEGHIIRQFPEANRKIKKDRRIQLYKSLGSQMIPVPDCSNLSLSDTHLQMQIAGLETGQRTFAYHPAVLKGHVITTSPPPQGQARKTQRCDLLVSLGQTPPAYVMPDLAGWNREDAIEGFKSIGIEVDIVAVKGQDPLLTNQVIRQIPAAGARIDTSTRVKLDIAAGANETSNAALRLIHCNLPPEALAANVRIVVYDEQGQRIVFNSEGVDNLLMTQWVWLVGSGQVIVNVAGEPAQIFTFPSPQQAEPELSE